MNLSENYHLRKCYLRTDTVPTMSVMKKKMSENLAAVYFKTMTPKQKVIAGLEPSLRGGGGDWYVPPQELLQGRNVLKPTNKELLSLLNHKGIDLLGSHVFKKHRKLLQVEKEEAMLECDINHRNDVELQCNAIAETTATEAQKKNTERIMNGFEYFTQLYRESLGKFELLFHEAAVSEIQKTREAAIRQMEIHYAEALKVQATRLYNKYAEKLEAAKNRLKNEFIHNIEVLRTAMADNVHDLKVDKHLAIENLRRYLESQKLACQVYVALKERDECSKEIETLQTKHRKAVRALDEKLALINFDIYLATQKEAKRKEVITVWQKKICHVIKKFQVFVSYCLSSLPDYAEFFLNMEKLMLIQLSQVLEKPTAESIIEVEPEEFHTPIPRPQPFYLFCDRGYKADIDEKLCPQRSATSVSQMPVIVVNKRCMYAACDTFEQFNAKIKQYIHGAKGDDADFVDDNVYPHYVPVKYTSSTQLLDIKLESSLLQVLQQEKANIRELPIKHDFHDSSCLCAPCYNPYIDGHQSHLEMVSSKESVKRPVHISKSVELIHSRQPKWESYFDYVEAKKCNCTKKAMKHLSANLPPYMQQRSKFDQPELLKYEMCSVAELKMLVKAARNQLTPPSVPSVPSRTRDVSTQCEDIELVLLCTCYDDAEFDKIFSDLTTDPTGVVSPISTKDEFRVVESSTTGYLDKNQSSFATDRILSLRNIVEKMPDLVEVFNKKDCSF